VKDEIIEIKNRYKYHKGTQKIEGRKKVRALKKYIHL